MRQPLRLASRPPPAALLGELPRRAQISGGQAADSRCGARREGHSSSLSTADSRCERATRGTTEFVVALRGVRRRAPAAAWRPPPPGARRRLAPAAAWRPPLAAPRPPPWRRRPAPAAAWRPLPRRPGAPPPCAGRSACPACGGRPSAARAPPLPAAHLGGGWAAAGRDSSSRPMRAIPCGGNALRAQLPGAIQHEARCVQVSPLRAAGWARAQARPCRASAQKGVRSA